jgi:hypothetical protein
VTDRVTSRRWLAATAIASVLAMPLLAGCGAGLHNETDRERATPYVGSGKVGPVHVGGGRLVLSVGGNAQAYLTLSGVNDGPRSDQLTNATIAGGGAFTPSGASTGLTLPPGTLVAFTDPDLGDADASTAAGAANLGLSGATTAPVNGTDARVTLTFANAGSLTVTVPVVDENEAVTTAPTYAPPLTAG